MNCENLCNRTIKSSRKTKNCAFLPFAQPNKTVKTYLKKTVKIVKRNKSKNKVETKSKAVEKKETRLTQKKIEDKVEIKQKKLKQSK